MRKFFKYLFFISTGIILLLIILLLFSQTAMFRDIVRNKLTSIVESKLNAHLVIEKIEGNFYNSLELLDLSISDEDDVIASWSSLKLKYNLWALRNKHIVVDSLLLENMVFNIKQSQDNKWNFISLFQNDRNDTLKKPKKQSSSFKYTIEAHYVSIKNGSISTSTNIDQIPSEGNDFNIVFDGSYNSEELHANLHDLRISTINPSLVIDGISAEYIMNKEGMFIDRFILNTSDSKIEFKGNYNSLDDLKADIETHPASKQDVALFVTPFNLNCSPIIETHIQTVNDTTKAQIELKNADQSIVAEVNISLLKESLDNKKTKVPYSTSIFFKDVVPEDWIVMPETHSLINGNIQLRGSHLLDFSTLIEIDASLDNSIYNDMYFNELQVNGGYENKNLEATIVLQTVHGYAQIDGDFSHVTSLPTYNISVAADSVNLSSFIPELKNTILNADILAHGEGFSNANRNIDASVKLNNSRAYDFPISTGAISVRMKQSQLMLDTLNLSLPNGHAYGSGNFDLSSKHLISNISVDLDSLSVLNDLISIPLSFDSLSAKANLKGPLSSLEYSGEAILKTVNGYKMSLGEMTTTFSGGIKKDSLFASMRLNALELQTGFSMWDTINAELEYRDNQLNAEINAVWKDTMDVKFNSKISFGDTIMVSLPILDVKTNFSNFYIADTLPKIQVYNNLLSVRDFWIKDQLMPDFNFKAHGDLGIDRGENFELQIESFDLNQLNRFIHLKDSIEGLLNVIIDVLGNSQNPEIQGTIDIEKPGLGTKNFADISSKFHYADSHGRIDIVAGDMGAAGGLTGSMDIDMEAYFDSTKFVFTPPKVFEAELKVESFDISKSFLPEVYDFNGSGILEIDISASGEIDNPMFYGIMRLNNGSFTDPGLGVQYDSINAVVNLDGKKIRLDTLLIKQEDGHLFVSGDVEFDSTIMKGNMNSSSIVADASSFMVVQNRNYEMQIDADAFVRRGESKPEFGGEIKVVSSEFNLEALTSNDKKDQEYVPILLKALDDSSDSTETIFIEAENKKNSLIKSAFLNNLTGRLELEIPSDTWIKSDVMQVELRGDIELVKTGDYFELFGQIEISRGHYLIYGKKISISDGEINFQGGEEFDPILNLQGEYSYRDTENHRRELELSVTGLLSDPTMTYVLDETPITESDAVSIIVFGKTNEELSSSGQGDLVGSVGSNLAAQLVSTQLNKMIGSRLKLDIIQVNATDNWQSAAIVVGKYVTKDLFVTYQRGFGEIDGEEITPETVTLEYELNRLLFLRLQSGSSKTSGFDVVLKFEQKYE